VNDLGDLPLEESTSAHFREFFANLIETQSPQTVRTYFQNLRTFLDFCVSEELIAANPMRKLRTPRTETKLLEALNSKQVAAIDAKLSKKARENLMWLRNRAIFCVLVETGLRRSECSGLTKSCWSQELSRLTIQAHTSKSRKPRYVFLGFRCARVLSDYLLAANLQQDDPLWISSQGVLGPYGIRYVLEEISELSEIAFSAHTLRRTFACEFLRNGGNLAELSSALGHTQWQMARRYLKIVETEDFNTSQVKYSIFDHLHEERRSITKRKLK
jgi:site-specific recombinase XerD